MILACPACATRYRVDLQDLGGPAGRTVRCANCGHAWHQAPSPRPAEASAGPAAALGVEPSGGETARVEALRPLAAPRLEAPPRPRPTPMSRRRRHLAPAFGWAVAAVLVVLAVLAVLAGLFARRQVAAMWPPAGRFYAAIGLATEPSGAGLVIGKIAPVRTADGLLIDGEIANLGSTPRDVPRLRVALQDAAEKEVQFELADPPKTRLQPGEIVHFTTPFAHPLDDAAGVVVTFASP
jgi:predicted Zn finger-like uncharacterized protein